MVPLHSACGCKYLQRHITAWCINSGRIRPQKKCTRCDVARKMATGFMLHSDQSFPGTPSQLCSRIGTDPENKEEISLSLQSLKLFFFLGTIFGKYLFDYDSCHSRETSHMKFEFSPLNDSILHTFCIETHFQDLRMIQAGV